MKLHHFFLQFLGVGHNSSVQKVQEAIVTSIRLFSEAVKEVKLLNVPAETLYPGFSCEEIPSFQRWATGADLYRFVVLRFSTVKKSVKTKMLEML